MKKLIFPLAVFLLMACQQPAKQYFESSPEIDMVKKGNEAYVNRDWAALRAIYADTAKVANNAWMPDKFQTPDQFIESMKMEAESLTDIKISDDAIYNMIVTDKGEKYVLNWFNWSAKTKDGKEVMTPVHLVFQIAGGKVAFMAAIYDNLPVYLALQPAAPPAAAPK
jgi:hypothetical protein